MIKKMTKKDFTKKVYDYENNKEDIFLGEKPTIIKFGAQWCSPCKTMTRTIEELPSEFENKLDIYDVDVDEEHELSEKYNIRSVPSMLFIPINEEPKMITGSMSRENLLKIFNDVLKVY